MHGQRMKLYLANDSEPVAFLMLTKDSKGNIVVCKVMLIIDDYDRVSQYS